MKNTTNKIKKLCIQFSKDLVKLGLDKSSLTITIKDDDWEKDDDTNYIDCKFELSSKKQKIEPFIAILKKDKILYSYIGKCTSA